MFTIEEARNLLKAADLFFDTDENDKQTLNLNDCFAWACSDGEKVEDADLPRVARLFFSYGFPGVLYWVVEEKRKGEVIQFQDVKDSIEYVKQKISELKKNQF